MMQALRWAASFLIVGVFLAEGIVIWKTRPAPPSPSPTPPTTHDKPLCTDAAHVRIDGSETPEDYYAVGYEPCQIEAQEFERKRSGFCRMYDDLRLYHDMHAPPERR